MCTLSLWNDTEHSLFSRHYILPRRKVYRLIKGKTIVGSDKKYLFLTAKIAGSMQRLSARRREMLDGWKMGIAWRRGGIFQNSEHWKILKREIISVKSQTVYLERTMSIWNQVSGSERYIRGSSRQFIKYRDIRNAIKSGDMFSTPQKYFKAFIMHCRSRFVRPQRHPPHQRYKSGQWILTRSWQGAEASLVMAEWIS